MPEWKSDAVPVLNRLRNVSLPTDNGRQWQPNEQEQAAIDKVWSFVGVEINEYGSSEYPWRGVEGGKRNGVHQRLRHIFTGAAFGAVGADRKVALKKFTRANCLKWGALLLAKDAAAEAANAAMAAANLATAAAAAAAEAAASVANESSDEDSTDPDTAISLTIASLPEHIRSTVKDILERAATAGYELSDWDELLRYARRRKVEAAVLNAGDSGSYSRAANELGAVNAAWERVMPPAAPSQFDEDVTRSRSDQESVFSFSGLSFVSQGEALQHLHRDMLHDRVRVDIIPGLKKKKKKKKKLKKVTAKDMKKDMKSLGKKIGKKIEKFILPKTPKNNR